MALASNALTALDTLKGELGISLVDASQDGVLERLINGASDSIEKYCNRKFARAVSLSERVRGYGSELIHVERAPVETIASVTIDGTTVAVSEYRIDDAEIGSLWRRGVWPWTAGVDESVAPHPRAGFEEKSIVVVYTGGFALAKDNRTPGTYLQPYDLEEACLQLAVYRYRLRGRNLGVQQETVGNASRMYGGGVAGPPDMPNAVIGVLDGYKRIR